MAYYTGTVNFFNPSKGFGFIASAQVQGDVFLGRNDLPAELKNCFLHPGFFELRGRDVMFRVIQKEGKQVATDVVLSPTENMPVVGTVVSYNDEKGYGFMSLSGHEGADVFFSKRDMPPHTQVVDGRALTGKLASFTVIQQADGKSQAKNIQFSGSAGLGDLGGKGGTKGGMGGKGGGKGGKSVLRDGQGAQGTIVSYNAQKGFGFISCPLSPGAELFFKASEEMTVGTDLAFYVKIMPDGKPQARDLAAALQEGQSSVGTVIRYVPSSGYGFIRIANQPCDVNFRKLDVPPELQEQELEGKTVLFTVKIQQGRPQVATAQFLDRPPPGYIAPSMEQGIKRPASGYDSSAPPVAPGTQPFKMPRFAAPAGAGGFAGSASGRQDVGQMMGSIVSFNPMKGFGFIQSPMSTNGDVYFKALNLPAEHQQRSDLVGVRVAFRGSAMPDGKLQANTVQVSV